MSYENKGQRKTGGCSIEKGWVREENAGVNGEEGGETMEGYYIKESEEKPNGVPSGKLNIEVANLQEFRTLLEQAEKEACQLKKTIDRLRWFNLEIEFTADATTSE